MKRLLSLGIALFAAISIFTLTYQLASAHEHRQVGKYTFIVGFLDEPAYAHLKNGLDLTICNGKECSYTVKEGSRILSNPVNDADKTLKVEVSTGSNAPIALGLEPRWMNPGKYDGYFMPATTGAYTFHIYGTVNNDKIDERFTSSPTGFDEVQMIQTYPATANQNNANVAALKSQVQNAQSAANNAITIGIVGSVLGLLGLVVAGFALTRKSRPIEATPSPKKVPADSLRG